MTITLLQNRELTQDGRAWPDGNTWRYHHTSGDMPLDVGSWLVFRMPSDVPAGSVITAALFEMQVVRFGADVTQSTDVRVIMEVDADPYPTPYPYPADNAFLGSPTSVFPVGLRKRVDGQMVQTFNYTAGSPTAWATTLDLTSMFQNVVNHPDYKMGGYVAVLMECTAQVGDLRVRGVDHIFATPPPQMHVDFTAPSDTDTLRTDINYFINPGGDTGTVTWGSGNQFGEYEPGQVTQDTTFGHNGSTTSLRWSALTSSTKASALGGLLNIKRGSQWTFSGWVYIPSAITTPVEAIFWLRNTGTFITARDQWVPFTTGVAQAGPPDANWISTGNVLPQIKVHGPTQLGWQFWADDLTLTQTRVRQRPWKDNFTPRQESPGLGWTVRERRVTTRIIEGGVKKPRRMYVKGADGLWTPTDPVRQSMSWDDLKTTGMTWDQLKATGKTWDELEAVTDL